MGSDAIRLNPVPRTQGVGALRWLPDRLGGQVPIDEYAGPQREEVLLTFSSDGDPRLGRKGMLIEADGRDVVVRVEADASDEWGRPRWVELSGDEDGSVYVVGPGHVNAVRSGNGDGNAGRSWSGAQVGAGSVARLGGGHGNAVVSGRVEGGVVRRAGDGHGHAQAFCAGTLGNGASVSREGAGRGFAVVSAAGTHGGHDLPHVLDYCAPMGADEAESLAGEWAAGAFGKGVPRGVPFLVGSLVASCMNEKPGVGDAPEVAHLDDLVALAQQGRALDVEWGHLPLVLDAVRGLVAGVDLARASPGESEPESVLARQWRGFVSSLPLEGGGGDPAAELGGLREVVWGLPGNEGGDASVGAAMLRVADALVCLEVVARMDAPYASRLMAAAGYVHRTVAEVRDWVQAGFDPGPVREAVADAAERVREFERGSGPGR